MSFSIGPYHIRGKLLLSPMAGITDRPYRDVCRSFGAALTTSEMITSDASLRHSRKTRLRMLDIDEAEPRSVQIMGTEPDAMAAAARFNVEHGAQIIDINMGCPAKKVCNKAAGSALMQDPKLVSHILERVVSAVDVPVTLKTRTGWSQNHRNVLEIAKIAEQCGIASLVVHGRTRNQGYSGHAEYETIRRVKQSIKIPVIANGDIQDPETARFVLDYSGADGLMLGRITQGQPWIFSQFNAILGGVKPSAYLPAPPSLEDKINTAISHIHAIHRFYGADQGVRIARKHIGWYLYSLKGHMPQALLEQKNLKQLKKQLFSIPSAKEQIETLIVILDSFCSDSVQVSDPKRIGKRIQTLKQHHDQGNINSTYRTKAAQL